MKFMIDEGGLAREIQIDELSGANLRQAAAIADAIARLIPHEGVDYFIDIEADRISFRAVNEKGAEWCDYLRRMAAIDNPDILAGRDAKKHAMEYISGLIPNDGVDYDAVLTFRVPGSANVSCRIQAYGEKGKFWSGYVSKMLRRHPPSPDYRSYMLPENPEPVVDESEVPKEMEKINEKVVS